MVRGSNQISKNFGKIFGYALGVLIFWEKFLRKKVYILYVHIEGRVVRGRKRGVIREGVEVKEYEYKYE